MSTITPFLWFDTEGEDAAKLYTSIFPNSKITDVSHYGSAGPRPEGMVMTVGFELDGRGKASAGFHYEATQGFQTEVTHHHLAFRGFTDAAELAKHPNSG